MGRAAVEPDGAMDGARAFAFFDIDGTLISEVSMASFYGHYLSWSGQAPAGWDAAWATRHLIQRLDGDGLTRAERNRRYYELVFDGLPVSVAQELCRQWLSGATRRGAFWKPGIVTSLRHHQRQGHKPVLVTGSFREVASAIGAVLGVQHWICAPLEEKDGRYTGRLRGAPTVGEQKALKIAALSVHHQVRLDACFAYGDDESDIPMLAAVGYPRVVDTASPALLAHASDAGWPVIDAGETQR